MILKIYASGIVILVVAIILNAIAQLLHLPSWYDFFSNPKFTPASFIWLCIIYPFFLGLTLWVLKNRI